MKRMLYKNKCEFCIHKFEKEYTLENTDQLLNLMQIYLSEWTHRDLLLWKQIFTYFFSTLLVMILSFVDLWGLSLGDIISDWIFPFVGLLMSFAFFIVGKGYAVRLSAIGEAYDRLIQKLPEDFRRLKLNQISPHSLSNMRMSYFIVYLMNFILTTLSVVLIIISIVR